MKMCFVSPLLLIVLAGCGAKPYEVARVSGRVTLDGKPLSKASITFVPMATKDNIAPGPTAAAFTDEDGRYTLGIDKDTPGSVVNKCRIFITSLIGDGTVAEQDHDPVMRALFDCPVHAITEIGDRRPSVSHPALTDDDDPAAHVNTESNEAQWGFTR